MSVLHSLLTNCLVSMLSNCRLINHACGDGANLKLVTVPLPDALPRLVLITTRTIHKVLDFSKSAHAYRSLQCFNTL